MNILIKNLLLNVIWWDYRFTKNDQFHQLQNLRQTVSSSNHSYQCFDKTKSIFVHTPKCAGVSISKALYGNLAGGHTTLDEYIRIFEPKCILSYFKFTIVRNPWDRLVSAYFFLKGGGWGENDRQLFEDKFSKFRDFNDFVENWLSTENVINSHQVFKPQSHFIFDSYNIVKLDYIGRFETLEDSFNKICKNLNIKAALPLSNKSAHKNYRDYYSETSKNLVSKVYEKDIDLLKYSF